MTKTKPFQFLAACGTATVILILFFETTSHSQDNRVRGTFPVTEPSGRGGFRNDILTSPNNKYIKSLNDVRISQKFNKLKKELKNAKSTEHKDQAKKSVRSALVEYFDSDMKQREAELEKLMLRSSNMSVALEKRAAAKEQLVDLQLKSFKYDVDGLGLFPKQGLSPQWKPATPGFTVVNSFDSEAGLYLDLGVSKPKVNPLKTAMDTVNTMLQKLRSANSEESRTKATSELRKALNNYFDLDLKARQQEIDKINAGLKKMQTGLQKRADAKDDIVDLQLQIIVNEAEGLGFFRKSASSSFRDDSMLTREGRPMMSPRSIQKTYSRKTISR